MTRAEDSGPFFDDAMASLGSTIPPVAIRATPFVVRDPTTLPRRECLAFKHYTRKFAGLTAASSGIGKTTNLFSEVASMVSAKALLGEGFATPLRVWILNLEDPADELERRMAATVLHFGLTQEDIGDRLFMDSGRDVTVRIATKSRDEIIIAEPIVAALIAEIRRRRIDVLVIDPFVSCHSVPENDNGAIDRVAKTWARIADETSCAVELIHHLRKPPAGVQSDSSVDDARGAVALIGAVRSARVLNPMSQADADKAGISNDDRRSFFRVDVGKSNMAAPVDRAVWRRVVGVPLDNHSETEPGDWVGVVESWAMPSALEGLSVTDLSAVQDKIAGGSWAENAQASNWAGHAVAEVLDIDASTDAGRQRIKSLLRTWIASKALKVERQRSARDGRDKPMIIVGVRS